MFWCYPVNCVGVDLKCSIILKSDNLKTNIVLEAVIVVVVVIVVNYECFEGQG